METKNWKWFRYDDIFNICKGFYNKKPEENPNGKVPFIGATESSNGITSLHDIETIELASKTGDKPNAPLEEKIFRSNCITVSNNGSVGFAFYQPREFTCSHDVNPLYLNKKWHQELNVYISMFLCTIIEKEQFRWDYGRKWRPKRMPASLIRLPIDNNGEPDWQWMEKYVKETLISELPSKTKSVWLKHFEHTSVSTDKLELNTRDWQWFVLGNLFHIKAGKYHYPEEYSNGTTPYVSATSSNNGIGQYIDIYPEFEGSAITTEKINCTAFYQPHSFCATSDVNILRRKGRVAINKYVGLFLASVIDFNEGYRWNYGRQCRVEDTKAIRLKLPAIKNAKGEYEPDWQWMEDYIKGLPYSGCL